MPRLKQPAVDVPENEGPPTALQDVVNAALVLAAFVLVGLGVFGAAEVFSPGPGADAWAAGRPAGQERREVHRPPTGTAATGGGVVFGQGWPMAKP
jgi:hypothetical protein